MDEIAGKQALRMILYGLHVAATLPSWLMSWSQGFQNDLYVLDLSDTDCHRGG
jgi:hypothetical protein